MKTTQTTCLAILLAVSATLIASPKTFAATTGFNQTAAGPWDYNTSGNWVGSTINGTWDSSLTLAAAQTATFAADTTLTTGLTFNYAGNLGLTLDSSSTTSRALTLGGDISLNTSGGTSANVTIGNASNPLTVALGASRNITVTPSANTLTIVNVISGTGFGITKAGAGTLTLNGANTYSGGTTINAGTLAVSLNNAALGTGSVTLNGGTLGIATSANNLSIVNNVTIGPNGGTIACTPSNKTLALTGALSGAGNLTIGGGGNNGTINPQFSANTMTSGTITLLGSASGTARVKSTTTSSAVLDWVFNGGGTDVSGTFNWGSFSGTGSYNAYNNNSGTTLYSIGGNNHDATYSGAQGQTGTGQVLSFLKVGTGAQTFSGASSYTGTMTVENGSLIAGANVSVSANGPFGNASSAIALGDATTISSATAMNPQLLTGGAFTMARTVTVGANNSALGNASTTFTIGGNTANSSTFSGAIT